ncbi:MAG: thioredoxin domain-containing protein [Clostridia bacterium]|nr:thioredoxin domain-containing protein [Clostridia bacterium]
MSNRLKNETSPYLLQHKENPVDWYPWCDEAFERAQEEDKPIFLSIGYSTCHWCHVMAHESFEDEEIADILNRYFISIKVDKEERPDIDNVYMAVCQAFTGSGGWPTSIFMTSDQKPFFAGTYFPKSAYGGMIGLRELLIAIHKAWTDNRSALLKQSNEIINHIDSTDVTYGNADMQLTHFAAEIYEKLYDKNNGGFGRAPKFPAPHNLIFLLSYYERFKKENFLKMAEHTLTQMYRGGMFDHIGFGFCRYSTDKKFLVPHFEKMLYDNALMILAYCTAYDVTKKTLYLEIAEKTAEYIMREMTSPDGGFYSAQDADSEGEEGKYYLLTPDETIKVLGQKGGEAFNRHFDISAAGNFEGKNIPNLLKSDPCDRTFDTFLRQLDNYRKNRYSLHLDDKILTSWNGLMIAAMCKLYLVSKKEIYLNTAKNADDFIQKHLCENDTLFVSFRDEKRGVKGFLDDYAAYIFAQLSLYRATLDSKYSERAIRLCDKVTTEFGDNTGGFYLYGNDSEELILRPKETYDGAIPSGNSLMAYNFVRLSFITSDKKYAAAAERQLEFIAAFASRYPSGYSMFLTALLDYNDPPMKVTVVPDKETDRNIFPPDISPEAAIILLQKPTKEYPLKNGKTTYYVCRNHSCMPPVNDLNELK